MNIEYGLGLLWSMQACFFQYALLLMLATFTYFIIKSLNKHDSEKHAKPKLPPGPKPWPIIGNLPEMIANAPAFMWIHKLMSDMDTDIACLRLGNVHVVPVSCPIISCKFLKKQDANFASRPISMVTDFISSGYLTTIVVPYGQQWMKTKKVVSNELISPLRLKWLHNKRIEEVDNLVKYVYEQCNHNDGLVNVRVAAQHYCVNVARKMFFNKRYFGEGGKDGGPGIEEEEHVNAVFTLLRYIYAFCVSDFMPCLRGLDLDGHEKIVKKVLRIIRKYHDPIIEGRIQQWKDGRKEDMEDWLDVLITLKDANNNQLLTSEEIKALIRELMIAIVDNPSNAFEWATAEMINQPELLKRATEELDSVVGKDRLVQESDLCKLNYVKACAKEAFRLHPISPFLPPHVCMADTIVANYFIPKGSHVLISRRGLGRNPKVWDDPNKFKPERHLKKINYKSDESNIAQSLTEPDLKFVSFGTGRRGCPGVVLGTSMTLMLFARMLHCFTWNVPPNVSNIDLTEAKDAFLLGTPLVATAKPRLSTEAFLNALY